MKNYFKYALLIALAAVLILPAAAKAATTAEVQVQINAIMQQIQALQQQVAQLQAQQGTTAVWCHGFNVDLKIGDSGSEVGELKTALIKDGVMPYMAVTYDFDEETASYVVAFQQKYADEILTPLGLQYGTGYVGSATRAKLNKLYGCGIQPPVCIQVITPAQNPQTGECKNFPTPCDVPAGWQKVSQCVPVACTVPACQIDYTLYDTGEKDSNGCSIKRCIPPTSNQPPVISGVSGPTTLKVNETGTWTVKASDPENGTLSYYVVWGDEASRNLSVSASTYGGTSYGQSATFTHSYASAGVYNPTFQVTDNQGLSAKTSISVNVGEVTVVPSITVLSPNGGESWQKGSSQTIKWNSNSVSYVSVILNRGLNTVRILADTIPNQGFYQWTVPSDLLDGNDYIIRISQSGLPVSLYDDSNAAFSIVAAPSITVLSPNGGESWRVGETRRITWQASGFSSVDMVKIYIDIVDVTAISSGVSNYVTENVLASQGYYNWTIAQNQLPYGSSLPHQYKIRINQPMGPTTYDSSDAPFSIVACNSIGHECASNSECCSGSCINQWCEQKPPTLTPSITVLSPNGGEVWQRGETYNIQWTSQNLPKTGNNIMVSSIQSDTKIEKVLFSNLGNDRNVINWTVPTDISVGSYTISVTAPGVIGKAGDTSDATFSIVAVQPSLTHCERCSVNSSYQWVSFDSTDSTCASVVPSTNPVTRTCNYNCPGNIGNSYPPDCRAAVGELRGKVLKDDNGNGIQDSGEVYLRDSSLAVCPNSSYVQSGIAINYSGPTSGSTSLNQCSPITGDPIYLFPYLPTGNYTVSVTVPSGWQATAARVDNPLNTPCASVTSCSNVPINSSAQTVVIFSMRPTAVGALAPSGQYSASILENIKAQLDQIQKAINDWH